MEVFYCRYDRYHVIINLTFAVFTLCASFQENKPLYSFEESGSYVTDARWSPAHPALFAAADAGGSLQLWNLNRDTEVPLATLQHPDAFTRLSWAQSGQFLTAGDDAGNISVYELSEVSVPWMLSFLKYPTERSKINVIFLRTIANDPTLIYPQYTIIIIARCQDLSEALVLH